MNPATELYLKIGGVLVILLAVAGSLYGAYSHGGSVDGALVCEMG